MIGGQATLGLILTGGLARRLGGADKGLLLLGGRPMLAHVVERLAPQCPMLALSANGDAARFAAFGLPVLPDDPPEFAGPLAGLLAGLEFCAERAPHLTDVATLPADAPFAPRDFVARLERAREPSGAAIALAASLGRTHPVAGLWPVALAPALRRALVEEGVRKVEAFAARFPGVTVEWPGEPVDPFFNVNAREDIARAEALLACSRAP